MNTRILIPAIASLALLAGGPALALAPAGVIDGLRIEKATPVVEACVRRQTNPPMQQIRQFSYAYPVPRDSRDPGPTPKSIAPRWMICSSPILAWAMRALVG